MSKANALILATGAAIIFYFGGALALGSPPGSSDSGSQVIAWFIDHRDNARAYAWSATFGTLNFAVVVAIVRGLLPAPHRDVFLFGGVALIIETAVQAWFWAALALRPDSLQPETARLALDIATFWGPILTGATMAMIGAVTVLGFGKQPTIPGWLTVLGAVTFLEQAVETITVFGSDGFTAPGGPMNVLLGAGLTLVWLVGLVVWAVGKLHSEAVPATSG